MKVGENASACRLLAVWVQGRGLPWNAEMTDDDFPPTFPLMVWRFVNWWVSVMGSPSPQGLEAGSQESSRNNWTPRSTVCFCFTKDIVTKLTKGGQIGRRSFWRLKRKGTTCVKEWSLTLSSHQTQRLIQNYQRPKCKPKTIKLFKENIGVNVHDLDFGKGFSAVTLKHKQLKKKIGRWGLIKMINFHTSRSTIKKVKRWPIE